MGREAPLQNGRPTGVGPVPVEPLEGWPSPAIGAHLDEEALSPRPLTQQAREKLEARARELKVSIAELRESLYGQPVPILKKQIPTEASSALLSLAKWGGQVSQ